MKTIFCCIPLGAFRIYLFINMWNSITNQILVDCGFLQKGYSSFVLKRAPISWVIIKKAPPPGGHFLIAFRYLVVEWCELLEFLRLHCVLRILRILKKTSNILCLYENPHIWKKNFCLWAMTRQTVRWCWWGRFLYVVCGFENRNRPMWKCDVNVLKGQNCILFFSCGIEFWACHMFCS